MPQGRILKKKISHSRKLANLKSDSARLLYTWLIPHLDIEGRFSANCDIVKGEIFPRLRHFSSKKIKFLLNELKNNGLIVLYTNDGDEFLQLNQFKENQRLRPDREAPSEIPAPPGIYSGTKARPRSGLSKVKLSKVKVAPEKDIEKAIKELHAILGKKHPFNPSQFNNKHKKKHSGARLHTFNRLLKEARGGFKQKVNWSYAQHILDSEHQNYNARDVEEAGKAFKRQKIDKGVAGIVEEALE